MWRPPSIYLSAFQNASSRLTLVLCPAMTIDRLTTGDFIASLPTSASVPNAPTAWRRVPAPIPVALSSTRTSPARGPARLTCITSSGLPASNARAVRTSIGCSRLRLWHDSYIWFWRFPAVRILLFCILVRDRACNDHVLALFPIHRRGHLVLGSELKGIDHAQDLIEIATGGHRIDQDQLDLLVRPDDEHIAHGLIVGGCALGRVSGNRCGEHAVALGHVGGGVRDDRIVGRKALRFLDVGRPLYMLVERIDRQADDLHSAFVELGLDLGHIAEFGRAYRPQMLGV